MVDKEPDPADAEENIGNELIEPIPDRVRPSLTEASFKATFTEGSSFKPCLTGASVASAPDPSQIRALPLSAVIGKMGTPLRDRAGKETEQAQETLQINDFLSYGRGLSYWKKYVALLFHYNLLMALVALYASGAVTAALTAFFGCPIPIEESGTPCFLSVYVGYFVFFIVLLFGNEMRLVARKAQPTVFLDRLCFDQNGRESKLASLKNLSLVLKRSERMVILYSSDYTKNLKSIYEAAAFHCLHPSGLRMALYPDWKAMHLIVMVVATVVGLTSVHWLDTLFEEDSIVLLVFYASMAVVLVTTHCIMARFWCRKVYHMKKSLGEFSVRIAVRSATFPEDERDVIQASIVTLMRKVGKIASEASQDEALSAFDNVVHNELPKAMEVALGPNLLDVRFILVLTAGFTLVGMDYFASIVLSGGIWARAGQKLIEATFVNCVVAPIATWAMVRSFRNNKMDLGRLGEALYVMRQSVMFVWPTAILLVLPLFLVFEPMASSSMLRAFLLLFTYVTMVVPLVVWLYRPEEEEPDQKPFILNDMDTDMNYMVKQNADN